MSLTREKTVVRTGLIGIGANVLLAGFKALFGGLAHSVAMVMDAVNNLSDALSSLVTIVGTRLAGKAPDKEHPMGYGRVEYLTALIVSAIVTGAGVSALIESVRKIIHPEAADYSAASLIVIGVAVVAKLALGTYTRKKGEETDSDALKASGADALSDAVISFATLVGAGISLIWNVNLEGWLGAAIAILIVRSGVTMTMETLGDILGRRTEAGQAADIKRDIRAFDGVLGVHDLYLDSYGPGKMAGSVHIEVDDRMTADRIDALSRSVSAMIHEKYGAVVTCGIYGVNMRDEHVVALRREIREAVMSMPGILQMHGFRLDEEKKEITFDVVRDFSVRDTAAMVGDLENMLKKLHPEYAYRIVPDLDLTD